ncbi:bestrophin family protein [Segnochrobactraceae bacterium EtOH-i3]
MIVRDRPSPLGMLITYRGSIIPRIRVELATTILTAMAVVGAPHVFPGVSFPKLTPAPFSLIGLALAIFLGFRNSASYDRWWEARKVWGDVLVRGRSLARLAIAHVRPPADGPDDGLATRLALRPLGFAFVLKHALRGTPDEESAAYFSAAEATAVRASPNAANFALTFASADIAAAAAAGRLDPRIAQSLEEAVTGLAADHAACERLRWTPLPFSYSLLLHRTAHLFCLALPFGLVDSIGYLTPFIVALIAYAFFGLDALGDELEEPFGLEANDLALDALCRRLEIDVLETTGRTDLPPVIARKGIILT